MPICKKNGVTYTEVQVANDGIAVVTNPDLKVDCMTVEQLKQVWNEGSKVNEPERGRSRAFPDAELSLFGPGTDSGTFDFFTDEINGEEGVLAQGLPALRGRQRARPGRLRRGRRLGYFGFSYYEQNQDKLNLVGVDDGAGCIKPSTETIQSGDVQAALAPAVHVPERQGAQAARGQGVHGLRGRELPGDRRGRADRPDEPGARPTRPRRRSGARWKPDRQPLRQGRAEAPSLRAARRRWGEDMIKVLLDPGGADLGAHDDGHRALPARRDDRLLRRRRPQPTSSSAPTGRRCSSRPASACCRWCWARSLISVDRDGGGRAARPRRRDLPVGVRAPRACARRSSRSSSCSPACPRSCSATSRSPSSRPRSCAACSASDVAIFNGLSAGHHHRLPDRPDGGLDLRGLDVGGAAVAARGRVRPRRGQAPDHAAGGLPRRAVRASSRRSCSGSRARSARRWSW